MENLSKRLNTKELPNWIPDKVKHLLIKETFRKEPIDLTSPEIIGKHFTNQAEVEDVLDVIKQVKNPNLIGIIGSRASLKRPPLFENIKSFDLYLQKKGDKLEYNSINYYDIAKKYLEKGFNENYKQGKKYPPEIVRVLVSDIDLFIISVDKNIVGGEYAGRRTNVPLDIIATSSFHNR
jgi:hypothetical protein